MNPTNHVSSITAVLLFLPLSLAAQTAPSPSQTARDFYIAYQKLHFSGLPAPAQANKLKPYLSDALYADLTRARTEQVRCNKAHPDEKGPWAEGDMFSSNFEGFTTVRVENPKPSNAPREQLKVSFDYLDSGQKFSWTDQVSLIKQSGRWVVDDIFYRRQQGFTSGFGESLRGSLKGKGC
jgi:hypothetical protein